MSEELDTCTPALESHWTCAVTACCSRTRVRCAPVSAQPPELTETEASTCSNAASPWSLILQVKPTRMKESPKQHNGAAPSAAGGLLLQLLAESFADLRFSAICGCWSGMVLQSAASPLPAPTPAHSNGSRGAAAAAAQAAPPVVGGTRLGGQEASSSSSSSS